MIESNPQDAELFFTRGTCFDKLGQFHKALEDYNKVIEIDPSDQDAINNRRMLLEEHPELKP